MTNIDRRGLLRMATQSLLTAPALAAVWRDAGAQSAPENRPLITKKIPSTGERIPAIGIGTNQFRADNYADLKAVLQRMHQLGGRLIDSANDYFDSELVVGRALAELGIRKQLFVTTKFNAQNGQPDWVPVAARDTIFGRESFDRSLQRLQTDHVDLLFIHHLPSVHPLMPLMQELKQAGKARYIGITTQMIAEHGDLLDKMKQYPIDFIQIDYSIANRDAAAKIFPVARERKIAVMVDTPFGGRRGPIMPAVAGQPLPPWAAEFDAASWGQFFLKYAISHPDVTCAIPGSTKVEHLVDNQLAGHGRLPDAAMRKNMEQFWDARA
jgi:aryl-alcohol dehydrogenase-like predicted oxidoreductase